jgi:hypothetical protein
MPDIVCLELRLDILLLYGADEDFPVAVGLSENKILCPFHISRFPVELPVLGLITTGNRCMEKFIEPKQSFFPFRSIEYFICGLTE